MIQIMFRIVKYSESVLFKPLQYLELLLLISIIVIFGEECDNVGGNNCNNVTTNNKIKKYKHEGYIIGGTLTKISRFPHAVCLLQFSSSGGSHSFCGSSVLNQRILLTAAHCVDGDENIEMYAYGGHENLEKVTIIREVRRYFKHPNYNSEDMQDDIALLFLDKETIPLGSDSPVKRGIISRKFPFQAEVAEISGWGLVDEATGQSSPVLKMVPQKVIPLDECQYEFEWMPGMMCAGDLDSAENRPARGDSGSGLVTDEHQIIGVVSFTVALHPGLIMYTNISAYYDWVVETALHQVCEDDS